MAGTSAKASVTDAGRILKTVVAPNSRSGIFLKDPEAAAELAAADAHGETRELLTSVRAKHDDPDVLSLLFGKVVMVFDGEPLRRVLEESATVFGSDPDTKRKGMEQFQPRAVTISTGDEWQQRRAFNDAVLGDDVAALPEARRFLEVVDTEMGALVTEHAAELRTADLQTLLRMVTGRVVLGDDARSDETTFRLLRNLMLAAQGDGSAGDDELDQLRFLLGAYLHHAEDGSLMARCPHAPQGDAVDPVDQAPHWLFASKDTLALNLAQAVAILSARADLRQRVRDEVGDRDLTDPDVIASLEVTGGVLEEAMRLWPTTWLLARRAMVDTELGGLKVKEGTTIVVPNTFNHRDVTRVPDADDVVPDRWFASFRGEGERDPRFNHLSNGPQGCAGWGLVHLLGRAVLAHVVRDHDLELRAPFLPDTGPMPTTIDPFAVRVSLVDRA